MVEVSRGMFNSALIVGALMIGGCVTTEELFAEYDSKFCVVPEYPSMSFRWEPVVYFKTDSDQLSVQGIEKLKVNIETLNRLPGYKVSLKGFADHQASTEYNDVLSGKRVDTVRNYLSKKLGLDPSLLIGSSHGENSPLTKNTVGPVDVDRRVEMLLINADHVPVGYQPLIRSSLIK